MVDPIYLHSEKHELKLSIWDLCPLNLVRRKSAGLKKAIFGVDFWMVCFGVTKSSDTQLIHC